ncbi:hypothetical protein ACHAQA_004981 [Verticillium albo-atrum]
MDDKKVEIAQVDKVPSNTSTTSAPLETNEFTHLKLRQSLWKWRRIVFYCMGMTSAILMYGYDYVIVGTVSAMPSFQRDFGYQLDGEWILPSLWLGLWNFASPGCSMIGALAGGQFQDRFGRRSSLAVGSFLSAIGVAVCFISYLFDDINTRRGLFLAGKGFQGGAIGMVMATTQTYMSEVLPPNLRGPLLAFFPIFTLLGQLIGAGVIYACLGLSNGYTICFATQWPFSALPMVVAFFIPESPTYLIRKEQHEKAFKSQKKLDGPDQDTEGALRVIRKNIEHEKQQAQATYTDSFRKPNRRRTFIVMFANLLPQLFGLTLLSKSSYFLQIVGMADDTSVIMLMLGIVFGLVTNIVSVWILSKVGRRRLLLTSLSVAALIWAGMGVGGIWSGKVVVWYTAASMISVVIVTSLGAWPCSHVISAETSALHLRAKAQGIGWFTSGAGNSIFGFVLPYIFNPDQGNLRAKTGFVFAGLCLLAAAVTFFEVPEMKGRTPGEIDRMFELGLSARQFKGWKNPSVAVVDSEGDKREGVSPESPV